MIVKKLEEIVRRLEESKIDATKSESGNASAGRRVRKVCMEATRELKSLRALILENIKQ